MADNLAPETVIAYQQENPKKAGCPPHARYELYKVARTIEEAKRLGASSGDLSNDRKKGFLTVEGEEAQAGEDGAGNADPDNRKRAIEASPTPMKKQKTKAGSAEEKAQGGPSPGTSPKAEPKPQPKRKAILPAKQPVQAVVNAEVQAGEKAAPVAPAASVEPVLSRAGVIEMMMCGAPRTAFDDEPPVVQVVHAVRRPSAQHPHLWEIVISDGRSAMPATVSDFTEEISANDIVKLHNWSHPSNGKGRILLPTDGLVPVRGFSHVIGNPQMIQLNRRSHSRQHVDLEDQKRTLENLEEQKRNLEDFTDETSQMQREFEAIHQLEEGTAKEEAIRGAMQKVSEMKRKFELRKVELEKTGLELKDKEHRLSVKRKLERLKETVARSGDEEMIAMVRAAEERQIQAQDLPKLLEDLRARQQAHAGGGLLGQPAAGAAGGGLFGQPAAGGGLFGGGAPAAGGGMFGQPAAAAAAAAAAGDPTEMFSEEQTTEFYLSTCRKVLAELIAANGFTEARYLRHVQRQIQPWLAAMQARIPPQCTRPEFFTAGMRTVIEEHAKQESVAQMACRVHEEFVAQMSCLAHEEVCKYKDAYSPEELRWKHYQETTSVPSASSSVPAGKDEPPLAPHPLEVSAAQSASSDPLGAKAMFNDSLHGQSVPSVAPPAVGGGGLFGGGAAAAGGGLVGQPAVGGGGLFGHPAAGGGLFGGGAAAAGGSMFGQPVAGGGGLFGQPAAAGGGLFAGGSMFRQAAAGGGGFFGHPAAGGGLLGGGAAAAGGSMFGQPVAGGGGLFGQPAASEGGLFGGGASAAGGSMFRQPAAGGGGFFGHPAAGGGLLGGGAAAAGGGLFGQPAAGAGGLFGQPAAGADARGGLFGQLEAARGELFAARAARGSLFAELEAARGAAESAAAAAGGGLVDGGAAAADVPQEHGAEGESAPKKEQLLSETPAADAPSEQAPAEEEELQSETPTAIAPSEQAPAAETSSEQAPADDAPTAELAPP